jgi:hypothetical protein
VAENVRLSLLPSVSFTQIDLSRNLSLRNSSSTRSRSRKRSSDGAATRGEAGLVVDEAEDWAGEAEWADEAVSPSLLFLLREPLHYLR